MAPCPTYRSPRSTSRCTSAPSSDGSPDPLRRIPDPPMSRAAGGRRDAAAWVRSRPASIPIPARSLGPAPSVATAGRSPAGKGRFGTRRARPSPAVAGLSAWALPPPSSAARVLSWIGSAGKRWRLPATVRDHLVLKRGKVLAHQSDCASTRHRSKTLLKSLCFDKMEWTGRRLAIIVRS